eukprot:c5969_g1_i1 orf=16-741(+)
MNFEKFPLEGKGLIIFGGRGDGGAGRPERPCVKGFPFLLALSFSSHPPRAATKKKRVVFLGFLISYHNTEKQRSLLRVNSFSVRKQAQMKGASAKGALSKKAEETNLKKKKVASKDDKAKKRQVRKERKAKKDPNKPKRAPSAFFVFLEEFRKTFSASNPNNKSVSAVGKAGGDKWKSMSAAEKAPYVAKADKRKAEYEKAMKAYNAKQSADAGGDDSDKSKSEVNDEDDEEEEDDEEDDE